MAKSKIVKATKKISNTVVEAYNKIENAVTGTYEKIEDKFVNQYLIKEGETIEEAKDRLKKEEQLRREKQEITIKGE